MEELIEAVCLSEAWKDYVAVRHNPRLGKLSALGIQKGLELIRKYRHLDPEEIRWMSPEDAEDARRLLYILRDILYVLDDPFMAGIESEENTQWLT
jgi:hypothetical protein